MAQSGVDVVSSAHEKDSKEGKVKIAVVKNAVAQENDSKESSAKQIVKLTGESRGKRTEEARIEGRPGATIAVSSDGRHPTRLSTGDEQTVKSSAQQIHQEVGAEKHHKEQQVKEVSAKSIAAQRFEDKEEVSKEKGAKNNAQLRNAAALRAKRERSDKEEEIREIKAKKHHAEQQARMEKNSKIAAERQQKAIADDDAAAKERATKRHSSEVLFKSTEKELQHTASFQQLRECFADYASLCIGPTGNTSNASRWGQTAEARRDAYQSLYSDLASCFAHLMPICSSVGS